MIFYRVCKYLSGIRQVEAERNSEQFITIKGFTRKTRMETDFEKYFDSEKDAIKYIREQCELNIKDAKEKIKKYQQIIDQYPLF